MQMHSVRDRSIDRQTSSLGEYETPVKARLSSWKKMNFTSRLWAKDPTLWSSRPVAEITDRLGWLILPEIMHEQLEDLVSFAQEVEADGVYHVVLLGMGGSSLAPEVFQSTFGNVPGYPELIVLDSTHPDAVRAVEDKIEPLHTLFLVSSKSGTTLETLSFFRYFWHRTRLVDSTPGRHFVAITDPGTPLMQLAQERGFRRVFQAPPDVGGRYSALTVFGLLPAALIGMDVHKFLDLSSTISESCAPRVPPDETSCLVLGAALGELAKMGRDKVTFLTSPSIRSFPVWLEQLIAESTGKDGKGIVPVVNEPLTSAKAYGADRFFVYLFVEGDDNLKLEELLKVLEAAGHAIVRINLIDRVNLSQEIFRWEIAVAAAGSILGVHPFNQPNVEMSKELARQMMDEAKKGISIEENVETLSTEDPDALAESLETWLGHAQAGNYVAIQAYVLPTLETTENLQKVRLELLNRLRLATTLGYGPRFLHSTGQLHKGGPNTGLFIQLVDEPGEDLPIPETNYGFRDLIQAQAAGDYQALRQLGRRVLRINLKMDVAGGLSRLAELIHE